MALPLIRTVQVSPTNGVPWSSTLAAVALGASRYGRISKPTEKTPDVVFTIWMIPPVDVTVHSGPRNASTLVRSAEAMAVGVAPPVGTTNWKAFVTPPMFSSRRQTSFAAGAPDSVTVQVSFAATMRCTAKIPPRVPGAGTTVKLVPNWAPSRLTITIVLPSTAAVKPTAPPPIPSRLLLMLTTNEAAIVALVLPAATVKLNVCDCAPRVRVRLQTSPATGVSLNVTNEVVAVVASMWSSAIRSLYVPEAACT